MVLASGNADKLRELTALIAPLQFEIVPQSALGVVSADEPHLTFVENALAKARHATVVTGLPALADDSGLCVDALNGAPGVRSARFAASSDQPADDERNNAELLRRLAGVENRSAHFTCVLAAVRTTDDPEPLIVDARWHGEILNAPRGSNGFGYDPLFFVRDLGKTAAELDPKHKNRISHRGLAFAALAQKLADWR
ncbi:MAG: RdgB/HAM1 family non-canonical purine NTP pyrophosphatase [Burkholderiaceae bacterium]